MQLGKDQMYEPIFEFLARSIGVVAAVTTAYIIASRKFASRGGEG